MVALESSSYRRQDLLPQINNPSPPTSIPRRATVSSPAPSFTFSNTFESHRPHSRADRYGFDHRYPYRRSTISGHSQGHNVNDAPQLTARADDTMMWSDSASSSPVISNTVVLQGDSPAPSSSGASPQLAVHPVFDYDHLAFHNLQSPMNSSFSLCPSPEFPNSIDQPRTMPPPLLPTFHTALRPSTAHSTAPTTTANTTPALSPAASSPFALDATVEPSNSSPPHHHYQQQPQHHQQHHQQQQQQHAIGRDELDTELMRLRNRIRELESLNEQLEQFRYAELVSADNKARVHADLGLGLELDTQDGSSSNYGHPHPHAHAPYSAASSTPTTGPTAFAFLDQDLGSIPPGWEERTVARRNRFCTPNRAGNALCAWHDSRRERRAFPPRMAPPNTLNCGCTFAEALFEESLSRNGVGSYHPGENVRMDPALRNPLLKLLERRYGYRDGDFERTPDGRWQPNEDAHSWEQKAGNSRSNRRER